jgi:serine/threonine protein phosphatase PrpC
MSVHGVDSSVGIVETIQYYLCAALEALLSLVERIATFVKDKFYQKPTTPPAPIQPERVEVLDKTDTTSQSAWKPKAMTVDQAVRKMWKNGDKAISEHRAKDPSSYADVAMPPVETFLYPEQRTPLKVTFTEGQSKGRRPTMEDAHFIKDLGNFVLAGVFDGHGGSQVSEFANAKVRDEFATFLDTAQGNVRVAMENIIDHIQQEVVKNEEWNGAGTTAVFCLINKVTHEIVTATIADSEAKLYEANKVTPLSTLRDWSTPKDIQRAEEALGGPLPKNENPKTIRFPHMCGINIARSIGDVDVASWEGKLGLTHKPKISINRVELKPDEKATLLIACDGFWSDRPQLISEAAVKEQIAQHRDDNLAQHLVDYAIDTYRSRDNVTVIAIQIE